MWYGIVSAGQLCPAEGADSSRTEMEQQQIGAAEEHRGK